MCFEPKRTRGCSRIDLDIAPPCGFIAMTVNFSVMAPAQGHGEFVADLAPKRLALGEAQMVGITRLWPQMR